MIDRNRPTDPAPLFPPAEELTRPGTPDALRSLHQLEADMRYVKDALKKVMDHLGIQ